MQSRRRSRKSQVRYAFALMPTVLTTPPIQKADMCRAAVPTMTERHGEENVAGIENIFETDNMTSEYSQEEGGLLSEGSWAEHKAKFVRGSVRAFEQRRKMWKSSEVRTSTSSIVRQITRLIVSPPSNVRILHWAGNRTSRKWERPGTCPNSSVPL